MEQVTEGATSGSYQFEILDSTSTTGGRKTGLVFNTSSLTGYYVRAGGSAVAITLATLAAANSAFSSGGFKEIDATNMPGIYRVDIPDAAFAAGAKSVTVTLKGATGMVQCSRTFQLNKVDLRDAVRAGLTALPNAVAGANGGVPLGDASGRVDLGKVLGTAAATPATAGILEVNVKNWNNLAAVELPLVPTTAGRKLDVSAGGEAGIDWANVGSPATVVGLSGTTIKAATDLTNAPTNGDLTAAMKTSVTTAATAATPTIAALGAQAKLDVNAEADTALSDAGVTSVRQAHLDADISSRLATAGYTAPPSAAANRAEMDTNSTKLASIEGKTTNLPSDPADQSLIIAATNSLASSIAGLNNLSAADVRTEAKGAIADYGGIL